MPPNQRSCARRRRFRQFPARCPADAGSAKRRSRAIIPHGPERHAFQRSFLRRCHPLSQCQCIAKSIGEGLSADAKSRRGPHRVRSLPTARQSPNSEIAGSCNCDPARPWATLANSRRSVVHDFSRGKFIDAPISRAPSMDVANSTIRKCPLRCSADWPANGSTR
jgi:hypothetical protein